MIGVMEPQAVRMCSDVTVLIVIVYDEFTMCRFIASYKKPDCNLALKPRSSLLHRFSCPIASTRSAKRS